jgi:hypothetical protein
VVSKAMNSVGISVDLTMFHFMLRYSLVVT